LLPSRANKRIIQKAVFRKDARSTSRTFAFTVKCIFAILLVMVGAGVHRHKGGGEKPKVPHAADGGLAVPRTVFCYGDSLTFGMLGMNMQSNGKGPYPYAKYLEQELNRLDDPDSTPAFDESESQRKPPASIVEHLGLPGWTASQMLDHINDEKVGICTIIHKISTLSLMIILVGTNDIAQMTNTGKTITSQIVDLHKGAIDCAEGEHNLHTLVVGIPGSAFQEMVPVASEMSLYVNNALKTFATSDPGGKISFVEFPIPYQDGDGKWSEDGLHLTEEGYKVLGKELAPQVKNILEKIDSE